MGQTLPLHRELVIDNFAGGGGASTGIEAALGFVDVAINHDAQAVAMHQANHPNTIHYTQNITAVDPLEVTGGQPVGLAWFSPDCKHFSKAKGGAPVSPRVRDLAWVVVHWAQRVKPRVIILENVEEFTTWGPLVPVVDEETGEFVMDLKTGQPMMEPCKAQRGTTFKRWVKDLRKEGYRVEWREIRAYVYGQPFTSLKGAPTSRKRLYLIARRDKMPIVWPEANHGPDTPVPARTAATCIEWQIPCPSIFERDRPLAEATLRRIARGIQRFVIDAADPFIIPLTHQGADRAYSLEDPMVTVTGANRGELAIIAPTITGVGGRAGQSRPRSGDEPMATITAKGDAALTLTHLVPYGVPRYGEREGQDPRVHDITEPMPTVVTTSNGFQLCAAFLAQHNTRATGHTMEEPVSTVSSRWSQQQLVTSHLEVMRNSCAGASMDEPAPTICAQANHLAEVRAFLIKYYGNGEGQSLNEPAGTVTTRDRFGLVTIRGEAYQIVDIGMRMLTPRELFRAQGFPDSYVIDPIYNGKPLTKTAQVRCCGNSVCPPVAEALVRANVEIQTLSQEAAQ